MLHLLSYGAVDGCCYGNRKVPSRVPQRYHCLHILACLFSLLQVHILHVHPKTTDKLSFLWKVGRKIMHISRTVDALVNAPHPFTRLKSLLLHLEILRCDCIAVGPHWNCSQSILLTSVLAVLFCCWFYGGGCVPGYTGCG